MTILIIILFALGNRIVGAGDGWLGKIPRGVVYAVCSIACGVVAYLHGDDWKHIAAVVGWVGLTYGYGRARSPRGMFPLITGGRQDIGAEHNRISQTIAEKLIDQKRAYIPEGKPYMAYGWAYGLVHNTWWFFIMAIPALYFASPWVFLLALVGALSAPIHYLSGLLGEKWSRERAEIVEGALVYGAFCVGSILL